MTVVHRYIRLPHSRERERERYTYIYNIIHTYARLYLVRPKSGCDELCKICYGDCCLLSCFELGVKLVDDRSRMGGLPLTRKSGGRLVDVVDICISRYYGNVSS